MQDSEKQRISELSQTLYSIIRQVSILKHLRSDSDVKRTFFANNAKQLPNPSCADFDGKEMLESLAALEKTLQHSTFDDWLRRHVHVAETIVKC